MERLHTIADVGKPYLLASYFITLINAWCVAHRFQGDTLQCHFGCGMIEGDRLEHYCICPVVLKFIKDTCPWLPLPSESHPSFLFFILDPRLEKNSIIAMAVLLHIIRIAYETRRSGRRVAGYAIEWDRAILEPTLTLARCKDPGVGPLLVPPEVRIMRPQTSRRKRRR